MKKIVAIALLAAALPAGASMFSKPTINSCEVARFNVFHKQHIPKTEGTSCNMHGEFTLASVRALAREEWPIEILTTTQHLNEMIPFYDITYKRIDALASPGAYLLRMYTDDPNKWRR